MPKARPATMPKTAKTAESAKNLSPLLPRRTRIPLQTPPRRTNAPPCPVALYAHGARIAGIAALPAAHTRQFGKLGTILVAKNANSGRNGKIGRIGKPPAVRRPARSALDPCPVHLVMHTARGATLAFTRRDCRFPPPPAE